MVTRWNTRSMMFTLWASKNNWISVKHAESNTVPRQSSSFRNSRNEGWVNCSRSLTLRARTIAERFRHNSRSDSSWFGRVRDTSQMLVITLWTYKYYRDTAQRNAPHNIAQYQSFFRVEWRLYEISNESSFLTLYPECFHSGRLQCWDYYLHYTFYPLTFPTRKNRSCAFRPGERGGHDPTLLIITNSTF